MTSQDIEVAASNVDELLAPLHVIRAFLAAGNDSGVGGDLSQPAAVGVDDGGVAVGRVAVVHRLVVDLDIGDAIRLGMAVGGPHLPPLGGRRVEQIVDPIHGILDRFGVGRLGGQHNHGIDFEPSAELHVLFGTEAVVVGVSAPEHVGVVLSRHSRADAVLPLVVGGKRPAGPTEEGRLEVPNRLEQIGPQHALFADVGTHQRDEIQQHGSVARRDDLYDGVLVRLLAREGIADLLPIRDRTSRAARRPSGRRRRPSPQGASGTFAPSGLSQMEPS